MKQCNELTVNNVISIADIKQPQNKLQLKSHCFRKILEAKINVPDDQI